MNNDIAIFSDFIAVKAIKEAECHPVDRFFLNPYIERILSFDKKDFLLYNLESGNTLYSEYLMLCLPELWEDMRVDDIIEIINQFTNIASFYTFILFTYKFVEIDITHLIFKSKLISNETKNNIHKYLKSQYPNFLKTETDFFFFEEGLYGIKNDDWMYVKQKLLIDNRIKPALVSLEELEKYFSLPL